MTKNISIGACSLYLCLGIRPDLPEIIKAAIDGGVDVIQLREKIAETVPILASAETISPICRTNGVPFFINDRLDIAMAVEADGVHLGQDDLSPLIARRLAGERIIIGRSTHGREELDRSLTEPIDYVSAGPVEATPTKAGREPTGLNYLEYATKTACVPVFVTGGVTPEKIPTLAAAGARHFVVVRYILDAKDAFAASQALRRAIDSALA